MKESQAALASNGDAKIFFSPLWVFAWNQSLRAQSRKSEMGKEIASVFYQGVQLFLGKFVKFHPLGKNHGFLSICPGWKSDISIMIWQISIWENCLLFSQWIWSKNEKSFTLSIKLFKRKKKSALFLPWNNGVGIKWEKSVTLLSSIKSSAILRKKEKKGTMWRINLSGQICYRFLIVTSRWKE